jgi:hypothetical protein
MSQQELLKKVVLVLEQNDIEYMLTGSLVSSMQGEPRLTHDIDIIINLKKIDINKILFSFPPEKYYISEKAIIESYSKKTLFNVIDFEDGDKIDFWVLTESAFDLSRFSRRRKTKFMDIFLYLPTPEDTILEKLFWSKISGSSEKHFKDALRVYEVQKEKLDFDYLKIWAEKLEVSNSWNKLLESAEY